MKTAVLCLAMTFVLSTAVAQIDTTPPYKRFPTLPPISLLQSDSSQLSKDDLKKNKRTIIMYFSPECHHCKHQMDDMIKRMDELRNFQIVMATYQPMNEILKFITDYQIGKYPNIVVGRDTKFLLPPFYRIRNLPYLALYDKEGKLITTFEGNAKIDTLINAFQ